MEKRLSLIVLVLVFVLALTACDTVNGFLCKHENVNEGNCVAGKTCADCGEVLRAAPGHNWQAATCETPKTCAGCGLTEGEALGHAWLDATTEAPKTCENCGVTEGDRIITDERFTTAATKHLQGTWICDMMMTDEMTGLENFGGVEVRYTMQLGNAGKLTMSLSVKDEKDYMKKLKQYTINSYYESFALDGMSKEQADAAMKEIYGLDVPDYVEAALEDYDVSEVFDDFDSEEVYYVKDGSIYTALNWKAKFEETAYTLKDGKLTIEALLDDNGEMMVWTKK